MNIRSLFTLFYITLLFSSFSSCSSGPIKMVERKTYSREVEKEFEEIENDQKRVLNYYRTLRERNWEEYKKKGKQISRSRYRSRKRKGQKRIVEKEAAPSKPVKPELSASQVEELNIEIHQNLSYFCMKNRKSGKFSDRSECQNFTQNIFNECKEKFPVYRDRSPVKCVKEKLH